MSTEAQNLKDFFNGAFYQSVPVDQNLYDLVYGYFFSITNSKESADVLTQTLLTVSYNSKINALDIIDEFKKSSNDSELKKLMIAVFNTNKDSTNKLGYSSGTTTNKWVARNIVA